MLISNSYSLEYKYEEKKGLFQKLHYTANVFKIICICLIAVSFWQIWALIGVGVSLATVVVLSLYKQRILFTYRYTVSDGTLIVKKIDINGNETVKEELDVNNIDNISIVEQISDGDVYFNEKMEDTDLIVKIEIEKRRFFILSDKYMYSILKYTKEKNGIS